MGETLARTSLMPPCAPGTKVNLERSVRMADRLGGHLVQGHGRRHRYCWSAKIPPSAGGGPDRPPAGSLARYVVHKGSIAIDGVSLTVSALSPASPPWLEVSLIPETLKRTTLGFRQPGELVNLEVDVMAKYVEKLLGGAQ